MLLIFSSFFSVVFCAPVMPELQEEPKLIMETEDHGEKASIAMAPA